MSVIFVILSYQKMTALYNDPLFILTNAKTCHQKLKDYLNGLSPTLTKRILAEERK